MNDLLVNTLIAWQVSGVSQQPEFIERILYILPSDPSFVVTIEIYDKRSLPVIRTYDELVGAISSKEAQILKNDPYASLRRPESSIKQKHREIRDKAWERI